ncbi:MAG: family 43 glycosylhydrolase [Tannerellaceae bacterium]|nr:family 43 glycosylhydrolase [Tannerellaceae bacterium]
MQFIRYIILSICSLTAFAQGNPFIRHIYTADPSAHVWEDGRLYVYASHDIAPPRGCDLMDEYHVFSTDDMVHWIDHGEILRASQVTWGKPLRNDAKFMWAPDCVYKNGTYYFYFPHPSENPWNSTWKIGVATSDKPASGFKVIGYIPDIDPLIDPCVFIDDDGQTYFYHGGGGVCKAGKLKSNMMEIDGTMKVMEGLEDFHEATWIHKRNGIYYLSYSDNHDENNDKEGVKGDNRMRYATSKSPLGPWKYQGIYMDPTDSYTNHGSIVEYKGQWYAFYHNSQLSQTNGEPNDWLRSVCVDKLYHNPDGTIRKVAQTDDKLRVGTAKINITPTAPAPGKVVHDSLYARSLLMEVQGVRIAFLSFDLGGYTSPALLESLKKKYNLDELYFCPSHTHSGATDRNTIDAKLETVLGEASGNMFVARIAGGNRPTPQLTFNRLIVRDDGHAREAWYADPEGHYRYLNKERIPFGPVDPSVGVIRIDDEKGNPRAMIMNFACHPDALVDIRSVISADYVGYAVRYVEEAFSNRVNCLFIQGGAGNQCALFKTPTDGTQPEHFFDMVDRMGKLLSIEAVALAKDLYPRPDEVASIRLMTDSLDLANRFDKDVARIRFTTMLINGKYAIATFPGEPFIKFQLDWKREMDPYAVPFFFGYTWNGGKWPTYVPDVRSAALGGYGADWGPVRAAEGGEAVMTRHLRNYYILTGLMRDSQGPGDHRLDDGTIIWKPDWMK